MTDKVIALFGILVFGIFAFNMAYVEMTNQAKVRSILAQATSAVSELSDLQNTSESTNTSPAATDDTTVITTHYEPTSSGETHSTLTNTVSADSSSGGTITNTTASTGSTFDGTLRTSATVTNQIVSVLEGSQSPPRTVETDLERQTLAEQKSLEEQRAEAERLRLEKIRLEEVGNAANRLNRAIDRAVTNIDRTIDADLVKTVETLQTNNRTGEGVRAFNEDERRAAIETLKKKIGVRTAELKSGIRDTLIEDVRPVETVLKSPLGEVQLLLESEVGVPIDLSVTARKVETVAQVDSEELRREHASLEQSGGLSLYRDEDSDGISDFDEVTIYKTDPLDAHTAGSLLTDGERILLGYDARLNSGNRVPVESPKTAPESTLSSLYEVSHISLARTVAVVESESEEVPSVTRRESIQLAGTAVPNGFATLFIYSIPIVVTVKADGEGSWRYILDQELENGEHELYVATVNNEGRIVARSGAIPFMKTAEAIEFTPYILPSPTPEADAIDLLQDNLMVIGVVTLLVFAVFGILVIGMVQRRHDPHQPV